MFQLKFFGKVLSYPCDTKKELFNIIFSNNEMNINKDHPKLHIPGHCCVVKTSACYGVDGCRFLKFDNDNVVFEFFHYPQEEKTYLHSIPRLHAERLIETHIC